MQFRMLGRTGLRVSEVSLGSWLTFGSGVDRDTATRCIRTAFDVGVSFFDTADVYAGAEEVLGAALRELPRSHVVVATKCFFPMSESPLDRGLSRKHIVDSVHRSLRKLGLSYVDVLQCHRFDPDTPVEETVLAMNDLIAQGTLLHWGMSRWTAAQLRDAVAIADRRGAQRPVVSQVPYNMLYRDFEADELPAAHDLGLGTVVYSPLAQGVLTGKYTGEVRPEGSRGARPETAASMHQLKRESLAKVDRLAAIAKDLDMPLARLALAWCLRRPEVTSVIIGASRPEQIRENVTASGVAIPPDVLVQIARILDEPHGASS